MFDTALFMTSTSFNSKFKKIFSGQWVGQNRDMVQNETPPPKKNERVFYPIMRLRLFFFTEVEREREREIEREERGNSIFSKFDGKIPFTLWGKQKS